METECFGVPPSMALNLIWSPGAPPSWCSLARRRAFGDHVWELRSKPKLSKESEDDACLETTSQDVSPRDFPTRDLGTTALWRPYLGVLECSSGLMTRPSTRLLVAGLVQESSHRMEPLSLLKRIRQFSGSISPRLGETMTRGMMFPLPRNLDKPEKDVPLEPEDETENLEE